jgi:FkbM family methyltransferase
MKIPPKCWRREIGLKLLHFFEAHDFPGAWRLGRMVSSMASAPPTGAALCSTNYGFDIVINPGADKGVERAIFQTGTYEHGTLEVIRAVLREGDIFLDIGANVGMMSLFAAQLVRNSGEVHSFEPVPGLQSMLSASIEANGFKNMSLHRFALGAKDEQRQIFEHPEVNRGSSSLMDWGDDAHGVPVSVSTLDGFAKTILSGKRIALAKIDVEGWELEVLKGGLKVLQDSNGPALCVEYSTLHPMFEGTHLDLYTMVTSAGYRVFKLEKGKSVQSRLLSIRTPDDLPEHDNIFCFKSEHLRRLDAALFVDKLHA